MPIEKSPNTIYVEHLKKGELAYQFSPGAGKAGVLSAPGVSLHRQRQARVAGEQGPRHRLRDDRVDRAGGDPFNVALIDWTRAFGS